MKGIIGEVYCANIDCVLSNDMPDLETNGKGTKFSNSPEKKNMSFKFNHEVTLSCSVNNFLGQVKETKTMQATASILLYPYI